MRPTAAVLPAELGGPCCGEEGGDETAAAMEHEPTPAEAEAELEQEMEEEQRAAQRGDGGGGQGAGGRGREGAEEAAGTGSQARRQWHPIDALP